MTQMRGVNEPSSSRKGVHFGGGYEADLTATSRTASPEQTKGRALVSGSRVGSPSPENRGNQRQRSRSYDQPQQFSGGQAGEEQGLRLDNFRSRFNNASRESFGN